MLEFWSQICQARDELAANNNKDAFLVTISGRQTVDDFTEVFLMAKSAVLPERFFMTEADLVVLEEHISKKRILAKVQEFKRKGDTTSIVLRGHLGSDAMSISSALVPRSQWKLNKLTSLSTMHREYAALKSLPYLVMCQEVIRAELPKAVDIDPVDLDKARRAFRTNEPQAMAVMQACRADGFSLIQGSVLVWLPDLTCAETSCSLQASRNR